MSVYIEGLFLPKINIPKGLPFTLAYLRIYEGIKSSQLHLDN